MDSSSLKSQVVGTFAIGAVVLLLFFVVTRGGASTATPTPSPTPSGPSASATAPAATALHSTLVARPADVTLAVGATATVEVSFKNTGTATWVKGGPSELRLGVLNDDKTFSTNGMAVGWALDTRPAVQLEPRVSPGQAATLSFQVKGTKAGTFKLALRPVVDGVAWLEDPDLVVSVTVR